MEHPAAQLDPTKASNQLTRGLAVSIIALAIWTFLAVRSPTLTYHFAPLLAAIAVPAGMRRGSAVGAIAAMRAGALSFGLVVAVSVVFHVGDYLEGPTFFGTRPALVEAVILAGLGAAIGVRSAIRKSEGLLAKLFAS
jgi:hypothetical protein